MLSLVIFMAALLIFIAIFNQSIQTGLAYQTHSALSTKTSDLLDTMLLNPGIPNNWSKIDAAPAGFGLQDPEFSQYKLSSLSSMRLASSVQPLVYYSGTGAYYSKVTGGYGGYLFTPALSYSNVSNLLGVRGVYGFKFTLTPTVNIQMEKTSTGAPLKFNIYASGSGSPLANTPITYNLIVVNGTGSTSYRTITGQNVTDEAGTFQQLSFPTVNGEDQAYALIVYAHLNGLKGMGYYVHQSTGFTDTVAPVVSSFESRTILLTHGNAVGELPLPAGYSQLTYNASFVIATEEYSLRPVKLDNPNATGTIVYNSGSSPNYALTVPDNDGILLVTYRGASAGQCGLALMPWGLGSMAFPLTFGGDPVGREWVTTDIRQVTISGIAYQAELSLWQENR